MDRRRLLLSLALAPVPPLARDDRACAADAAPVLLQASGDLSVPEPALRYGDHSPGPVLRLARGASTRLRLLNGLGRPTSLDLHGLRSPPPLGGSGPLGGAVAAGAEADVLLVPPDSGTFWFHPWILDPARDLTSFGLAGVLVVEDAAPPDVDVDWVAVLTERPLAAPAAADNPLRIDGHAFPRLESLRPGSRVRLRLVNASTRQVLTATMTGALPAIVAIDGQPSELFTPRGGTVPLAPGARTDLVFDMPAAAGGEVGLAVGGSDSAAVVALRVRGEGEPRGPRGPIVPLPPNPLLPRAIALETAARATLAVDLVPATTPGTPVRWTVNGVAGPDLPKTPLLTVKRGRPVSLAFRNLSRQLVAFRVHGFCLRLLHDLDDGWEPYWRDTVVVPPGATHHAAFVADAPGRWLIESPFFDQAAGGLRSWLAVT